VALVIWTFILQQSEDIRTNLHVRLVTRLKDSHSSQWPRTYNQPHDIHCHYYVFNALPVQSVEAPYWHLMWYLIHSQSRLNKHHLERLILTLYKTNSITSALSTETLFYRFIAFYCCLHCTCLVSYPAPGRGTGYCFRGISFFLSLLHCQQYYEKTAGPICMKFSGKVWNDHGTIWLNFGSIRVNGSAGQRSICLLSPATAQRTGINKSVSFARWQQGAGFVVPRTTACLLLYTFKFHLSAFIKSICHDHNDSVFYPPFNRNISISPEA